MFRKAQAPCEVRTGLAKDSLTVLGRLVSECELSYYTQICYYEHSMSNLPEIISDPGVSKTAIMAKRLKEIGVSERNSMIWECLSHGMTLAETAKKLKLSHSTVSKAIKDTLAQVREYALQDAEDWRSRQLLILDQQIMTASEDAMQRAVPLLGEDGEQVRSRSGAPRWELSPMDAAKIRNMGGNRLIRALENQAKLLDLVVERHQVDVRKVSISVVRGDQELIEGL